MYPALLYPGERASIDPTKPILQEPHLDVRHRLTYYNPLSWIRAAFTRPVDIFHVQWWSLALWPVSFVTMLLMRLRGKTVIITVHNVLPHDRSPLFVPASRILCRLAHKVLVHSTQNREQLVRHYRIVESRIGQVPHGVFFSKARRSDRVESRRALGIAEEAGVVLLFGAVRAYKGVDVLLQALALASSQIEEIQLVVAGKLWTEWEPYSRILEETGTTERVHLFPEYVPEERTPLFFSAADVVVLPYTSFDAQSGVAATALPSGKPMIVSRTGGLPDWVAGDENWIVEPGDVDGLAQRLIRFFAYLPEERAAFSRIAEQVLHSFSPASLVEAYRPIYEPPPNPLRTDEQEGHRTPS